MRSNGEVRYKHVLALNPYFGHAGERVPVPADRAGVHRRGMKDLVGRVTLLDLRYEKAYRTRRPSASSSAGRSTSCASASAGGRGSTGSVTSSPNCPMRSPPSSGATRRPGGRAPVRAMPEHRYRRTRRGRGDHPADRHGRPHEEIRGLSYRRDGRIVHNENSGSARPDAHRIPGPISAAARVLLVRDGVRLSRTRSTRY